jgi:hypothetical protein
MKKILTAFVTDFVSPSLKSHGFKKNAYLWNRSRGAFIDVISVQEAIYSNEQVTFTLNLGVAVPKFLEDVWRKPFQGFATEADCAVRARLGDLIQGKIHGNARDQWWSISDHSGSASLGVELAQHIEGYVFPFLDHFDNYESIASHLRESVGWIARSQFHIICSALAESMCGRGTDAIAKLESIQGDAWRSKIPYLQEIINEAERRHHQSE